VTKVIAKGGSGWDIINEISDNAGPVNNAVGNKEEEFHGGDGKDVIYGGKLQYNTLRALTIKGGSGDDKLYGGQETAGKQFIEGNGGKDFIDTSFWGDKALADQYIWGDNDYGNESE